LYFRVNQTFYEVHPSSYLINATYQNVGKDYLQYCTIGIMPTNQNFIILGTTFMKNFYIIFDLERDIVGISNLGTNATMFQGKAPEKRKPGDDPITD
jgi:hypothetical protein